MPLPREEVERLKTIIRNRTLTPPLLDRRIFNKPLRFTAGVGLTDQEHGYQLAVRVYDQQTRQWFEDTFEDLLKEHENDVNLREVGPLLPGEPTPPSPAADNPPLQIGMGVRHEDGNPGTLGFFARRNGTRGFVSCNHVIAILDRGRNGDPIRSVPGNQIIGELARFHKLRFFAAGLFRPRADCAYAAVPKALWPENPGRIPGVGDLVDKRPTLTKRMRVMKIGQSTHLTHGIVTSCDFDRFEATFEDQFFATLDNVIEIESAEEQVNGEIPPFATGGDSGSLVFTESREPVGMVFYSRGGGSNGGGLTYANPIAAIEAVLHLRLVVAPGQ